MSCDCLADICSCEMLDFGAVKCDYICFTPERRDSQSKCSVFKCDNYVYATFNAIGI